MALLSYLEDGILAIRSVGDQELEEGLQQMQAAIDLACNHHEATGNRVPLLVDLRESEENKDPQDLRSVAGYLAENLDVLSGRIAVVTQRGLRFGLARMFAVYGENVGLATSVFTVAADALAWLKEADGPAVAASEDS